MENRKHYSVTGLVNELQLPRSTVNDWLGRYEQYIEFTKRGKRKLYYENSLKVLKEIAELRAQEKSSYEIEQELARSHPVQAEVAATQKTTTTDNGEKSSAENMLPSLKQQSDELVALFGNRFEEISQYITTAEQQNKQVTGKIRRWYLTAMLLFALLTAAFAFAVVRISKVLDEQNVHLSTNRGVMLKQNDKIVTALQSNKQNILLTNKTIVQQATKIDKLGLKLDRNSTDYAKNIAELKQGLKEQRERFAAMLEDARKSAAREQAAELARQRDAFAKQQLKKLRIIENMGAKLKNKQAEVEMLKLRLAAKQASLDEVMRRADKVKNSLPKPIKIKQHGKLPTQK